MLNGNNQERGGGQAGWVINIKEQQIFKSCLFPLLNLKSQSERRVLILVQSRLHATTEVNSYSYLDQNLFK